VLVVDDRPDNRLAFRAQLQGQDIELLEASSGEMALDLLLSHEVALALIDVQMPVMDGFQLAELMRGMERTRHIPIIFVTAGLHDQSKIFRGYDAGAIDFLVKPIESHILNGKVSVLLQLHRQKEQLAQQVEELKRIRENLTEERDKKAMLAALAEESPNVFVIYDAELRYRYINRAGMAQYRVSESVVLGKRDTELFPTEVTDNYLPYLRLALDSKQTQRFEATYELTEGDVTTYIGCYVPLLDRRGRVKTILGINTDITERKRVEDALRVSEARFRSVLENSRDLVYRFDLHTKRFDFVSPSAQAVLGYTVDEVVEMGIEGIYASIHVEDRNALRRAVDGLLHENEVECEYRQRTKSGEYRWMSNHMSLVRDEAGVPMFRDGIIRDISERKRIEGELRMGEERAREQAAALRLAVDKLEATLSSMAEGVVVYDQHGRMERMNAAAESILGTAEAEWRKLDESEARIEHLRIQTLNRARLSPKDAPVARALAGETVGNAEFCMVRPGAGEERWLRVNAAPVRGPTGEVVTAVATFADITNERHVAERLRSANESLREADRRKNDFLAVLSHEMRNPLAPIRNALHILERATPGSEIAHRSMDVLHRQVEQLVRLIDDLLDVTRIARNKLQIEGLKLELNQLLNRAADDQRCLFEGRGVTFTVTLAAEPIWILGDPGRLTQVIGNLLNNAAKFTPTGGTVTLASWTDREQQRACFRVADTGAGISEQALPTLFQPFAQATETLGQNRTGLGLGLALVKGLVEAHGGTVTAESAGIDQGAQFTVVLPLHEE
jgi:PAS domain S-box-containing protein